MRRFIGLALSLSFVACGAAAPRAPGAAEAPLAAPTEPTAPIEVPTGTPNCPDLPTELNEIPVPDHGDLTLLTAGAEPRHELRYKPALGTRSSFVFRTETDSTVTASGGRITELATPRIVMTIVTDVIDVRDDGSFVTRRVADQVAVEDREGVTARTRHPAKQSVAVTECLVVEEHLDARGFSLGARTSGTADMTIDGLRHLLPIEPVGVGATWEVRGHKEGHGMLLGFVTTYELRGIDGTSVLLAATSELTIELRKGAADKQLVGSFGQQQLGTSLDLETMTPIGSFNTTIVLDTRVGRAVSQTLMNVNAWFAPD